MKYLLLAVLAVLSLFSLVAMLIRPEATVDGKPVIVWASDDNPRRRHQIDLFNQQDPPVRLELDAVNNSGEKVFIQSMAGVGPHVFDSGRWRIVELAQSGMLVDLTDALAQRGVTLDQFWPIAQDCMSLNGRIVGIPANLWGDALWYHRDLFDEAGLPYPPEEGLTWEEFIEIGKKLVRRDKEGRIIRYAVMGMTFHQVLATQGGRIFTRDGRRCVVDSEEAIGALQKWIDLQTVHHLAPTPAEEASISTSGGWGSGPITLFKDKRTAMAIGGRWWLCTYRDLRDAQGKFPLKLGVAEPPITKHRRYRAGARVVYANAMAPRAELSADFMAFLGGDVYNDQINLDADAMPGLKAAATRPSYYHDPLKVEGGDGGASPVWRRIIEFGVGEEVSPYINTSRVDLIINKQVALAREGKKSAHAALADAAAQINSEIAVNLSRDPILKERFDSPDTSPVFNNFPSPGEGQP